MIEMENVTKRYGNQVALDGLNLTVKRGEILGFLGPNGAGKSTAMNILTGYISATNGNVRIDGIDILENPEAVKKKIGYLPEIPPLYLDMTVEEYLKFVFRIKKVKSDSIEQSMIKIMSLVKILDVRGRLIKNLSKGYKQRIGLAQALVGDPEVLVLDEPTVGLDPKQIIEIRNLIQKIGKTCTIILSSHILSEVSAICHRVIIINKGKIVASGTPEELSKGVNNSNKVLLRVKGVKEDVYKHIKAVEDVKSIEEQGVHEIGTVDLLVEAKNNLDIRETLFVSLSQAGFIILMMKSKEINLEEIFLDVTTNKKVGGM
ncbi:ABC transporter ATP-binding protein [Clostridium estertheticum]|uniref:ABC transporter ATP-binding protein n=1 Tax=Clostridium estertheticum TaxID=238834 RepID=UPI001C0E28A0|nr:ATP-binding cassette domain-containing protein [Clostridium estertheticum]MBU3214381.1 ABC transporter ATP-binding protein [Clostridium estertheticum]WAG56366.1 ABC transporter ATP-binding protein [Clostridium estertheticum]